MREVIRVIFSLMLTGYIIISYSLLSGAFSYDYVILVSINQMDEQ